MNILPPSTTLQEKVMWRYNQAVHDDKVPSDCISMAEDIEHGLATLTSIHQAQRTHVTLQQVMDIVLAARAWRVVADLIHEDLKFIEAFDEEEEAEREAFLRETSALY